MESIGELSMSISKIDNERKYWFFRSLGGAYYTDFFENRFVGIGYNEISMDDLYFAEYNVAVEHVREKLKLTYPVHTATYATSQLFRFARQLRKGDVIIVPNNDSRQVVYGILVSERAYMKTSDMLDQCPYLKRWDVEWVYREIRGRLNPKLFPIFNSRHIITDISKYAPYIDSTVSDLYVKGNRVHFVINIKTDNPILIEDFNTFCNLTSFFINDLSEFLGETPDNEQEIKIGLQSRGRVEIISKVALGILGVGLLINGIVGGEFEADVLGAKFKLNNPGLLKIINDYRNENQDRKQKLELYQHVIKKMDIDTIRDVNKIIEIYNTINR